MKNLFRLFLVIFSLFAIVSCGGEDTSASDEEQKINVSIRSISDIAAQIAAMHFLINDEAGNVLFEDSLGIEKLGNKTVLTGIKNGENATLTIRVFAKNAQGDTESTPKWIGKVRGLNFKKGKTTGVDIMLYSATVGNTETVMPSPLMIPRFGHTATVLDDGRVLIAGGFTSCTSNHKCQVTKSVEIIDVETGHVEHLADMLEARAMHHAVKMGDGSIVFIGGVSGLNTTAQTEDEAFENYPPLPYSFSASSAVKKMERYVLNYLPFNQRKNNSGTVDYDTLPESYSEYINAEISFKAFQSIFVEDQATDNKVDVFLVGGLDLEDSENSETPKGKPSNKSYKFSLTLSNGKVSASEQTELADASEPMLLPALAPQKDNYGNIVGVLAVGGRPNNSEYSATFISESDAQDRGNDSNLNLFFTNNVALNNNLYTFGGFNNSFNSEENKGEIKNSNKILRWSVVEDSVTSAKDNDGKEYRIQPGDKDVTFAETVYDEFNERFVVIGGTNAETYYQVINATTLEWYQNKPSHTMTDGIIMSKAVIIPIQKSPTGLPLILITGGINSLDGTGTATGKIKFNNL